MIDLLFEWRYLLSQNGSCWRFFGILSSKCFQFRSQSQIVTSVLVNLSLIRRNLFRLKKSLFLLLFGLYWFYKLFPQQTHWYNLKDPSKSDDLNFSSSWAHPPCPVTSCSSKILTSWGSLSKLYQGVTISEIPSRNIAKISKPVLNDRRKIVSFDQFVFSVDRFLDLFYAGHFPKHVFDFSAIRGFQKTSQMRGSSHWRINQPMTRLKISKTSLGKFSNFDIKVFIFR